MNRRAFIASAIAAAAVAGCADSVTDDPELEALRIAARVPGPAEEKLKSLTPAPRRPDVPLPYHVNVVPGFSAGTHRVHWGHHYLEYLWRWESGERELLEAARELAMMKPGGVRKDRRRLVLQRYEEMRQAANMVVLHQVYWKNFWSGAKAPNVPLSRNRLFKDFVDTGAAWTVAGGPPDGEAKSWALNQSVDHCPFGWQVEAAIDWQSHAWKMDFATVGDYLDCTLKNMNSAAANRLANSELHVHDKPLTTRKQFDEFADSARFKAGVVEICAQLNVDPEGVAEGLSLVAGPEGRALLFKDMKTSIVGVGMIGANRDQGILGQEVTAVE